MTALMEDTISRKTRFILAEYSGEHNRYDRNRLHPMNHKLVIVSVDGTEREIAVGQLETFLQYAAKHPSMGKALDAVYLP